MSLLTVQLDLRLRRLTPTGLEDCVLTFTHYDLPESAAGGDWSPGERLAHEATFLAFAATWLRAEVVGLLDHCRWEQPELPFP